MQTQLEGLTVLVTGASGGIGEALVRAFLDEGANVIAQAHRHADALQQWVEREGLSGRVMVGEVDVRDPAQLDRLVDDALNDYERIDVAVANAGIWPAEDLPLHRMAPARVREVLDVDLLGAMWTCRAFMKQLAELGPRADGRGASLCLIGSTAGRFGEANHVEYAVAKAGLYGLVRSLKNELVALDPYARINMVEPGWTVTPMATDSLAQPGVIERVCTTMPLRQLARAADIAAAVLFLSAPALSRHVSGEILTVAGGMEGRRLWTPEQIDAAAVRRRVEQ
jgi:3-oxoacyl-[acyl-carrier protein] reductase